MHSKYIGSTINDFLVLDCFNKRGPSGSYNAYFVVKCLKCGREQKKGRTNLLNGEAVCTCSRKTKDRHSAGFSRTKLNKVYRSMLDRCNNPRCREYKNYGGRGIKVCPQWEENFKSFYLWAIKNGYREGLSIDRIDNDGNYEPQNCRFADAKTQSNNRRCTIKLQFKGETKTITQWAEETGISNVTIYERIRRGWPAERALTERPGGNQ